MTGEEMVENGAPDEGWAFLPLARALASRFPPLPHCPRYSQALAAVRRLLGRLARGRNSR